MMNTREIAELAAVLAQNANVGMRPGEIARDVLTLRRLGARALTRSVKMCNEASYTEDKQERDRNSIMKAVGAVVEPYGVTKVEVGGDPRGGSALTLHFKNGTTNSFAGEGWNV